MPYRAVAPHRIRCGIPHHRFLPDERFHGLTTRQIQLRGVAVHNLKHVDLDIPHRQLVVFCGVSGSGKTSLALDTLYAEGQRRYIESFSAYTRQFLEQMEKPAAERIDGIPPAIAVTRQSASYGKRSTVGTSTEVVEYFRLLYARIGRVFCQSCSRELVCDTPQTTAEHLSKLPNATRFLLTFPQAVESTESFEDTMERLRKDGFVRAIVGQQTVDLRDSSPSIQSTTVKPIDVVVDRLTTDVDTKRLRDSLELAFSKGQGMCHIFLAPEAVEPSTWPAGSQLEIDGKTWQRVAFSVNRSCETCGTQYPDPEPRLFSFNSPLGACPTCEGFGNVVEIDMDLVVPDGTKSIREGAIAPWNTPAYAHELAELLDLAKDYQLPVDVPFNRLEPSHLALIHEGVPERKFGGLNGFFAWLQRRTYKMHLRVFLNRWRSQRKCESCNGTRLRSEALATQIGGKNIAELCQLKVCEAVDFFKCLDLTDWQQKVGRTMLEQVRARLGFLDAVGLGYLTIDRGMRTLSGGEAQRVALTSALGSTLVNMLYVLDEPTVGLHPHDVEGLVAAIVGLCDRGNSVVVVEHEEAMLRAADQLIEIGPEAGDRGGEVTFQGKLANLLEEGNSLTGEYLAGRRGVSMPEKRRSMNRGSVKLTGAKGHNLKDIKVEFPLGLLCLVTGVSGSGKTTLVQETLYGALCRRLRKESPKPLAYDDVYGDGQLDDVMLVDQSPIGRSPRSNPVTYVKAFDEIRSVFAETIDSRTHNYTAGHFSFNVDGGRCTKCKGDGYLQVDMQFLADIYMKCDQCSGTRYRKEILDVKYRNRSIADVLEMTVREAFTFFRGQPKVQAKLKQLKDVGLDYLRLGQPANTLSSGEAQRLKLASFITSAKRKRTLFILDEPTTGLHFADVVKLIDCFDALLSIGHSLIVVEHNTQLMCAADYIIDLGPGAAEAGGEVVVAGTPEEVSECEASLTGRILKERLTRNTALDR